MEAFDRTHKEKGHLKDKTLEKTTPNLGNITLSMYVSRDRTNRKKKKPLGSDRPQKRYSADTSNCRIGQCMCVSLFIHIITTWWP